MYQKLFQQGFIGGLKIKNRVAMTAMGVGLANTNGEASDDIIRYYEDRAKGGCGIIFTEVTRINDENGVGMMSQLSLTKAKSIPKLQRLMDTVHKYDTKIFIQLHHPGRQTSSALMEGRQPVAPSPVMCQMMQEMPRELTTAECEEIRDQFIQGAALAKMAGADGIELHGAHGYLLNEFLSPYTNKRTDQYGGSEENRMRLMAEIIGGVRMVCGPRFPISVRISADEFVEGGIRLEDSIRIAVALEKCGIDVLNVSTGIYESMNTIVEPGSFAEGWKKNYAKEIKKHIKIPVIAVNNIKDPKVAEALLEEDVCDFIGLGRATLADPEWVNKAENGQEDQIRKCIGCLYCFEGIGQGRHIACTVNAKLGREREFDRLDKDGNQQPVAVIGAGPGGMEAARVLAERNFKVTLFEKADKVGGTLNIADKPPLKDKITRFTEGMANQLAANNVEIKYNVTDAVKAAKAIEPVGVFVACGATPIVPSGIPGILSEKVVTAEEVLRGDVKLKGNVAVIGSGMTGCETAELLAEQGCRVSLVEMQPQLGPGIYPPVLLDVLGRFQKHDHEILVSHRLEAVTDNGVQLMNLVSSEAVEVSADYVVLALGVKPQGKLIDEFTSEFHKVVTIGDASRSGRIIDAIRDGYGKAFVF